MDYSSLIRSPNALMLMCLMLHETDEGKRPFIMSQVQIGNALGLGRQQVREALAKLVGLGMAQPTSNQPRNQAATYLTCCKISICGTPKTNKQPTAQPTNNQVQEQFETLWERYQRRGSKAKAKEKWLKLTDEERGIVMKHAPLYCALTVTQYTKYLEVYLNQRFWESSLSFYGLPPLSLNTKLPDKTVVTKFLNWYNTEIAGTLLPEVTVLTEERAVLVNFDFGYFGKKKIADTIIKAIRDPYNSGALPLTAGKHIQTFEEIMHPNNILRVNE